MLPLIQTMNVSVAQYMGEYNHEMPLINYCFSVEETNLINNFSITKKVDIKDILIAAIVEFASRVLEIDQPIINVEYDGRDNFDGRINVSRTLGWFCIHHPVMFKRGLNFDQTINNVSNSFINIPIHRSTYNLFPDSEKVIPKIYVNYFGNNVHKIPRIDNKIDTLIEKVLQMYSPTKT
jgi:hypothetical protein